MTSAMPRWTEFDRGDEKGPRGSDADRDALQIAKDPATAKMTKSTKPAARIDKLMDLAGRALVETHYFECEAACIEALALAHGAADYERMARILLPLQEARRQIRLQAVDSGNLFLVNEPIPETDGLDPGCYLIGPPLVGADARDLHDRATREEIPVVVLAFEPPVKSVKLDRHPGDWPVVMIGPVTVRAYLAPPEDGTVTMEWFEAACEAIGDRAITDVDEGVGPISRVNDLYERLQTVSDHEKLHQALEAACREAVVHVASIPAKRSKAAVGGGDIEAEEGTDEA